MIKKFALYHFTIVSILILLSGCNTNFSDSNHINLGFLKTPDTINFINKATAQDIREINKQIAILYNELNTYEIENQPQDLVNRSHELIDKLDELKNKSILITDKNFIVTTFNELQSAQGTILEDFNLIDIDDFHSVELYYNNIQITEEKLYLGYIDHLSINDTGEVILIKYEPELKHKVVKTQINKEIVNEMLNYIK